MKSIFDISTEKYDAWYDSEDGRPLYESELLCLKPFIEDETFPILEIGVGTGRFAEHFPRVIGVDPAFNALKCAQKRGVDVVQAIGEQLPFRDETFAFVMLIVTLCFVQNPIDVLREGKRVLKRNGSIVIGLVPKNSPWGAFYEKKKRQGHLFYSSARFYSFQDVEEMLENGGLKITRIRSTLFQRPEEPRRIENPIEEYMKEAGFLCIEVKKKAERRNLNDHLSCKR
jgi:ubiquinone/menaquinone biosynthesis C-methylase UbiE